MVIEAREEFVCEKCNGTWAIEPEPGYRTLKGLRAGGFLEPIQVNPKHVVCPFCGSRETLKSD